MPATRLRRSVTAVLLTIFIDYIAFQPVHGFLFTPKFQIYLNALRGTHHEFVFKWDGLNGQHNNGAGFSYAANQNGKFDFRNVIWSAAAIRLCRWEKRPWMDECRKRPVRASACISINQSITIAAINEIGRLEWSHVGRAQNSTAINECKFSWHETRMSSVSMTFQWKFMIVLYDLVVQLISKINAFRAPATHSALSNK